MADSARACLAGCAVSSSTAAQTCTGRSPQPQLHLCQRPRRRRRRWDLKLWCSCGLGRTSAAPPTGTGRVVACPGLQPVLVRQASLCWMLFFWIFGVMQFTVWTWGQRSSICTLGILHLLSFMCRRHGTGDCRRQSSACHLHVVDWIFIICNFEHFVEVHC